jgi:hypothetical protein
MVIRIVAPGAGGAAEKTCGNRLVSTPRKNFPSLARSVQLLFARPAEARKSRSPMPAESTAEGWQRAIPQFPYVQFKEQLFMVVKAVGLTSEEVRPRRR